MIIVNGKISSLSNSTPQQDDDDDYDDDDGRHIVCMREQITALSYFTPGPIKYTLADRVSTSKTKHTHTD